MKKIEIQCNISESISLNKLIHFQGKIKTLSEEKHQKLRNRILSKGFRYPFHIWVDENKNHNVLDGHQRLAVLLQLEKEGYEIPELPIHRVYCASLEEAKEEVLAISSQYGDWNKEELNLFIEEFNISLEDFSLNLESFDSLSSESLSLWDDEFSNLKKEALPPIVEKEEYISCLGTLWELNDHKIFCCSCAEKDNLEKSIENHLREEILVLSDPPYGISLLRKQKQTLSLGSRSFLAIEGDLDTEIAKSFYESCLDLSLENFVIWGGNYFTDFLPPSRVWFVWDKKISEDFSFSQAELAWTSFQKGGVDIYEHRWSGYCREGDKTDELVQRIHPNQKPVALIEECLRRRAENFSVILDGFSGSGSFLIAAEKTHKKYIGFEIMPAYCDAIVKRWIEWRKDNELEINVRKNGEAFTDFENL